MLFAAAVMSAGNNVAFHFRQRTAWPVYPQDDKLLLNFIDVLHKDRTQVLEELPSGSDDHQVPNIATSSIIPIPLSMPFDNAVKPDEFVPFGLPL